MRPKEFLALDKKEKAFIIAAIQIKAENEPKEPRKAKKGKKRR